MKKLIKYVLPIVTTIPLITAASCGKSGQVEDKKIDWEKIDTGIPTGGIVAEYSQSLKTVNGVGFKDGVWTTDVPIRINKQTYGLENFANGPATLSEPRNEREQKERAVLGTPFTPHFHTRDLAKWSADKDVDSAFNKSYTPLNQIEYSNNILASQTHRQVELVTTFNKATSFDPAGTTSQEYGAYNAGGMILTNWTYLSRVVSFGGSLGEGDIVVPKGQDTDTAHRNGTKMLGTVFFAGAAHGGNSAMYDEFMQHPDETSTALVSMAKFYGFDGWFLNFEAPLTGSIDPLLNFCKLLKSKADAAGLFIELYDFGTGTQLAQNGQQVAHNIAVDYQRRGQNKSNYGSYALGFNVTNGPHGADEGGSAWSWPAGTPGNGHGQSNTGISNNDDMWIFGYHAAINSLDKLDSTDDLAIWSNSDARIDPREWHDDSDEYPEVARWTQERTIFSGRKNFATSFERGFGRVYNVNGEVQDMSDKWKDDGWKNLGLQDYLPNYRWITDIYDKSPDGHNMLVGGFNLRTEEINNRFYDWTVGFKETPDAYNGGQALNFNGYLKENNDSGLPNPLTAKLYESTKLFATKIDPELGDKFEIIIKGDDVPKLSLYSQGGTAQNLMPVTLDGNVETIGAYKKVTYTIDQDALDDIQESDNATTVYGIGVGWDAEQTNRKIDMDLESFKYLIHDSTSPSVVELKNFVNLGNWKFRDKVNVRLGWETEATNIHHYLIYTADSNWAKQKLVYLTSTPAAFIEDLDLGDSQTFVVEAYDNAYNKIATTKVKCRVAF